MKKLHTVLKRGHLTSKSRRAIVLLMQIPTQQAQGLTCSPARLYLSFPSLPTTIACSRQQPPVCACVRQDVYDNNRRNS